jgi:hypothetical protein
MFTKHTITQQTMAFFFLPKKYTPKDAHPHIFQHENKGLSTN